MASDASVPKLLLAIEIPLLAVVGIATSVPGSLVFLALAGTFGCFLLGIAWLILFIAMLAEGQRRSTRAGLAPWLAVPIVGLIGVAVVALDLPLRTRFELSKPAFEAAVATLDPAALDADRTIRLGLYDVDIVRDAGIVFFLTPAGGLINDYGFAFSPDGGPGDPAGAGCHRLDGQWWLCQFSGSSD